MMRSHFYPSPQAFRQALTDKLREASSVALDKRLVVSDVRSYHAHMANHPAPPLAVSESEAEALRAMTRAGTTEQRTALRAKVILRAAEGVANVAIAAELGISVPTVGLWRTKFKERGLAGLADSPRSGRPATYGRAIRERVLVTTLTPPEGFTHWSTRRLAKAVGVSPNTILRIWREGKLKPHRVETFKYSSDPELVAKVTDVVGLYLDLPARAR